MADDRSIDLGPRVKLFNVLLLGITFMLIFTGFQTSGLVSQTVLKSYKEEHPDYNGVGYTSLAIIYIVFAVANWIAPSIVSILGPKYSMIISALTYTAYIATFIKPVTATLYVASVLIGIGAAVLWTAQGNFLTLNSDDLTMGRNSGLFWALLQCSLLFGNMYVYFAWRTDTITDAERIPLFIGLTAISGFGALCMFGFRSRSTSATYSRLQETVNVSVSEEDKEEEENGVGLNHPRQSGRAAEAWLAFLKAVELFKTQDMLLLSVTFFYTGLELTFFSGVYGTSVGATSYFGDQADRYIGLTGIMIGIGEILGGATFGIFGKQTVKYGRSPVILLGLLLHIIAFFLIFLNIPDEAPMGKTDALPYITPNVIIAMGCGVLLGAADACFNTQCYSIIGVMFPDDSAPAFALFKFEQSLAAAIGFFYSNHLVLKWQLLILVVFAILGSLSFFKAEKNLNRRTNE